MPQLQIMNQAEKIAQKFCFDSWVRQDNKGNEYETIYHSVSISNQFHDYK